MLGWYIPGLSELPLGSSLLSLLAGPFQRVFVFSISLGTLGPFSFFSSSVSCACVYSKYGTAGERGTVAGVSGWWWVEGGVARSAVAVFVARRRVCIETRGKHEWALSGLLMWFRLYYARVCKGRFDMQKVNQEVPIFATKLEINEGPAHSEY